MGALIKSGIYEFRRGLRIEILRFLKDFPEHVT